MQLILLIGGEDMLTPSSPVKVLRAKTQCRKPVNLSGSSDFDAYARYLMNNRGPNNWEEALKLYFDLSQIAMLSRRK